MKKDLSNIIKNVQNTDIPPFPLDNSELTSVLERVDRSESSGNSKLFTKRGIKMTSIITSILMLGIFGINYLSNDPQPATVKSQTANVKQANTTIGEKGNMNVAEIKEKKDIKHIVKSEQNLQKKFITLNTIKLTDEELAEFGISYDSIEIDKKYKPAIGYWQLSTLKSSDYNKFAKERSIHQIEQLPSKLDIKYIKRNPDLLTNFDGIKRTYTIYPNQIIDGLDEFMVFQKTLMDLFRLEFHKSTFPKQIPEDIDKKLIELQSLSQDYQSKTENRGGLGRLINNNLQQLYKYFLDVSNLDSLDHKKQSITPQDTNISSVMILYTDDNPDSSSNEYVKKMAKMGVKIVYSILPYKMQDMLKERYNELEILLSSFKKQVESFIMVNKMLAIEVPYKNGPKRGGLIFWYFPSKDLIDALPIRYRDDLRNEFKLLEDQTAICGAKIESEKCYLDVWRACSGAIENLRVFPNPVKSDLNIRFELKESRKMSFAIHGINGNKIKDLSASQQLSAGSNSAIFDLSNIKTGIYLIIGTSDVGETVMQRIIKE